MKNIILVPALAGTMLLGGAVAGYVGLAAAQTAEGGTASTVAGFMQRGPHIGGEITAINGTTLTVSGRGTTYTVNAGSATVMKDGATSALSALTVGEHVHVKGTLDGTNVTAESIFSGMTGKGGPGRGRGHGKGPGVMGTVSAVNGSTITVTGMNGTTYTVEAGSASVKRMVDGSLADVAVGDRIGVQGTVLGTTVSATQIMDDMPEKPMQ